MKNFVAIIFILLTATLHAEETFDSFEIRVIRPRFFSKIGRFEVGLDSAFMTNQTFIYTLMSRLSLGLHFNNEWSFILSGYYGISRDKLDKKELKKNFDISTLVARTQMILDAELSWVPIYGKYQLSSGSLIYYDTHITAGPSYAGIKYLREHCTNKSFGPITRYYPATVLGIGQQFYMSKNSSIRWDIKDHLIFYEPQDGDCKSIDSSEKSLLQNFTLQLGYSYFI